MIRITHRLFHYMFMVYLRRRRVHFQSPCFVLGKMPLIENQGVFRIGARVYFRSMTGRISLVVRSNATLTVGENVLINDGVNLCCSQSIIVGAYTKIADEVMIYDTNFHSISQSEKVKAASIDIGRNVWIGARAIILPGTVIGDHSVIAAGSVVRGEIPARSIAAGVPAKVIGSVVCDDDWVRK